MRRLLDTAALKSQGIAISRDTVHQFLAYLEDCFLVRIVWMESSSERQRMVNPRKAYPVDAGLIPVFDRTGRANIGHALETAVLIELERRRCEVAYVRTHDGYEVDFLAREADGRRELWFPSGYRCCHCGLRFSTNAWTPSSTSSVSNSSFR